MGKDVYMTHELTFIDSYKFMSSGLDKLVSNITEEGQAVVDFAKRMELAINNTFFVKKPAHRVTYSSGGCNSQVDYIMMRRCK